MHLNLKVLQLFKMKTRHTSNSNRVSHPANSNMRLADRLRGIYLDKKAGPRALRWSVDLKIQGRRYFIRACSDKEAVYIRHCLETHRGVKRRGDREWTAFCFPDMINDDDAYEGYITICGRTFRMREPWDDEKALGVRSAMWFSYCKRPPHACLPLTNSNHPTLVKRVPLRDMVGRISECGLSKMKNLARLSTPIARLSRSGKSRVGVTPRCQGDPEMTAPVLGGNPTGPVSKGD